MAIRILLAAEIEKLSARADFSDAAAGLDHSAEFHPIDAATRAADAAWRAATAQKPAATFHFLGSWLPRASTTSPAEPRAATPSPLPIAFDVEGLDVDGVAILFFSSHGLPRQMFGLSPSGKALVPRGLIPLGIANQIKAPELLHALARISAQEEARALAAAAQSAAAAPHRANRPARI